MERDHQEHEGGEEFSDDGTSGVDDRPETEPTPPEQPRIFLVDASPDRPDDDALRGIWLDAAIDADELRAAAESLLAASTAPGERHYRIAAASGFAGYDVDEHESLEVVARVAHGVAAHGRPFAAYVDTWGTDQEAVDAFSRFYVGSWPSLAHWAETVAEDLGWWDQLNEHVDPRLLSHLRIDFESLGRELTYDAYVVEDDEQSQIHVFRLHA